MRLNRLSKIVALVTSRRDLTISQTFQKESARHVTGSEFVRKRTYWLPKSTSAAAAKHPHINLSSVQGSKINGLQVHTYLSSLLNATVDHYNDKHYKPGANTDPSFWATPKGVRIMSLFNALFNQTFQGNTDPGMTIFTFVESGPDKGRVKVVPNIYVENLVVLSDKARDTTNLKTLKTVIDELKALSIKSRLSFLGVDTTLERLIREIETLVRKDYLTLNSVFQQDYMPELIVLDEKDAKSISTQLNRWGLAYKDEFGSTPSSRSTTFVREESFWSTLESKGPYGCLMDLHAELANGIATHEDRYAYPYEFILFFRQQVLEYKRVLEADLKSVGGGNKLELAKKIKECAFVESMLAPVIKILFEAQKAIVEKPRQASSVPHIDRAISMVTTSETSSEDIIRPEFPWLLTNFVLYGIPPQSSNGAPVPVILAADKDKVGAFLDFLFTPSVETGGKAPIDYILKLEGRFSKKEKILGADIKSRLEFLVRFLTQDPIDEVSGQGTLHRADPNASGPLLSVGSRDSLRPLYTTPLKSSDVDPTYEALTMSTGRSGEELYAVPDRLPVGDLSTIVQAVAHCESLFGAAPRRPQMPFHSSDVTQQLLAGKLRAAGDLSKASASELGTLLTSLFDNHEAAFVELFEKGVWSPDPTSQDRSLTSLLVDIQNLFACLLECPERLTFDHFMNFQVLHFMIKGDLAATPEVHKVQFYAQTQTLANESTDDRVSFAIEFFWNHRLALLAGDNSRFIEYITPQHSHYLLLKALTSPLVESDMYELAASTRVAGEVGPGEIGKVATRTLSRKPTLRDKEWLAVKGGLEELGMSDLELLSEMKDLFDAIRHEEGIDERSHIDVYVEAYILKKRADVKPLTAALFLEAVNSYHNECLSLSAASSSSNVSMSSHGVVALPAQPVVIDDDQRLHATVEALFQGKPFSDLTYTKLALSPETFVENMIFFGKMSQEQRLAVCDVRNTPSGKNLKALFEAVAQDTSGGSFYEKVKFVLVSWSANDWKDPVPLRENYLANVVLPDGVLAELGVGNAGALNAKLKELSGQEATDRYTFLNSMTDGSSKHILWMRLLAEGAAFGGDEFCQKAVAFLREAQVPVPVVVAAAAAPPKEDSRVVGFTGVPDENDRPASKRVHKRRLSLRAAPAFDPDELEAKEELTPAERLSLCRDGIAEGVYKFLRSSCKALFEGAFAGNLNDKPLAFREGVTFNDNFTDDTAHSDRFWVLACFWAEHAVSVALPEQGGAVVVPVVSLDPGVSWRDLKVQKCFDVTTHGLLFDSRMRMFLDEKVSRDDKIMASVSSHMLEISRNAANMAHRE